MLTQDEIEGTYEITFRQEVEDLPDEVLQDMLKDMRKLRLYVPPSLSASPARDVIRAVLADRAAAAAPPEAGAAEPVADEGPEMDRLRMVGPAMVGPGEDEAEAAGAAPLAESAAAPPPEAEPLRAFPAAPSFHPAARRDIFPHLPSADPPPAEEPPPPEREPEAAVEPLAVEVEAEEGDPSLEERRFQADEARRRLLLAAAAAGLLLALGLAVMLFAGN